jgi:hypothetical protein
MGWCVTMDVSVPGLLDVMLLWNELGVNDVMVIERYREPPEPSLSLGCLLPV